MDNMEIIIISALLIFSLVINILLIFNRSKISKLNNTIKNMILQSSNLEDLLKKSSTNINSLISENSILRNKVESISKEKNELVYTNLDDRVLFEVGLSRSSGKVSFKVLYECDIIEVSEKRLKIKPTSFTSDDKLTRETVQNYQEVLNFYKEKWVNRSECELIIEDKHTRDAKLKEVLDEN